MLAVKGIWKYSKTIIAESEYGIIRVADKFDIIWLKQQRNSLQDQTDIERLLHEKLETVLAQLSDLYEFNKKLKSYKLQKQEKGQGVEVSEPANDDPAHALRRDVADE